MTLAPKRTALIVEDDPTIAGLLQLHLQDIGCQADIAGNGEEALRRFRGRRYDLVVLDLMLPGLDGLEVCRALRSGEHYVPILMLTAKSSELDRVVGLEIGADDYLTKPFSIPELLARIKALFRRADAMQTAACDGAGEVLRRNRLTIDVDKREVTLDGDPVGLTAREFDLLLHFARHPGRVFTRSQLLEQVWGYHHSGYEHTVNSHINRLRAKIERDPARPELVITVWGVGYKLNETDANAP